MENDGINIESDVFDDSAIILEPWLEYRQKFHWVGDNDQD